MPPWMQNSGNDIGGPIAQAIQAVTAAINPVMAMVTATVSGLLGVLSRAVSAITSALGSVAMLLTGAVTVALGAFATGIGMAAKAAQEFSHNALALRNQLGMGLNESFRANAQFGAFGINGSQLAGMMGNQNPLAREMMLRMHGLPSIDDPNFLPALAGNYQGKRAGGPLGFMMANNMLGQLGLDNPQIRGLVNLPQDKIREQLAYQGNLSGKLGLDPEKMRSFGEELPLLLARVSMALQGLAIKLGEQLLPTLESGLTVVSDMLLDAVPAIVDALKSFARWLYADFPVMVVEGSIAILNGLGTFAAGLTDWGADLLEMLGGFLDGLGQGNSAFSDFVGGFFKIIDYVSVGLDGLIRAVIAPIGVILGALYDLVSAISEIGAGIFNAVKDIFHGVLQWLADRTQDFLTKILGIGKDTPYLIKIPELPDAQTLGSQTGTRFVNPLDWIFKSSENFYATDLYGQWENLSNSANGNQLRGAAGGLRQSGRDAQGFLGGAGMQLGRVLEGLGRKEDRRAEYDDRMLRTQEQIAKNTGAIAANTAPQTSARAMTAAMRDMIARTNAYRTEDAFLGLTGI